MHLLSLELYHKLLQFSMIYRCRDMIYGFCRMIYLRCKYDIISVPSYAEGIYHPPKVDIISKIYHPFRKERISLKKVTFVSRQKWLFSWQRMRDSNPRERSQSPVCYRYTNPLCATHLRHARILLYPFHQKSQAVFSFFSNFFVPGKHSLPGARKIIRF